MTKNRWTIARIRNRWLRGIAAWLVVLAAVVLLGVLAVIGGVIEAAKAFWHAIMDHCRMFLGQVIRPSIGTLLFRA